MMETGRRGLTVDTPLLDLLDRYVRRGGKRWHTPGHKGNPPTRGGFLDWSYDITEIGELLASPNAIEQSEALMARTYGADRTWYSVNGATQPVMAGVLAAFPFESTLFVDRSVHRSVLSALVIGGYHVRWLYPSWLQAGLVLPLTAFPDHFAGVAGLVVTRPTYDGLAGPIETVIARAHGQNLTVVVDEAHGSHWQGEAYPASVLSLGADLATHGVHKSESTLTQTGLLHVKGERVSREEVDRWWRLLQTSSPSYLLMGSLDRLQWERRQPDTARRWDELAEGARILWRELEGHGLVVLQSWAESKGLSADPARLTILGDGPELRRQLAPWGEVEKVTPGSATLFLAPGESLDLLKQVLVELAQVADPPDLSHTRYPRLSTAMNIRDAWGAPGDWVALEQATDCVVKDALTPYPPGIPLAVPGEMLTKDMIDWLMNWMGTRSSPIEGVRYEKGRPYVWVIHQ